MRNRADIYLTEGRIKSKKFIKDRMGEVMTDTQMYDLGLLTLMRVASQVADKSINDEVDDYLAIKRGVSRGIK